MSVTISQFIVPRLEAFQQKSHGYPANLTQESWNEILQKMIQAFTLVIKEDTHPLTDREATNIQEGLILFANYFRKDLWN